ncbi:hypothetical protein CEXT_674661 [Caerostris extrusa]|uniref:Uncharacterized protein n=1 Tax=Caerostris extrusa TaxID=172846 RepID=A0AAV4THL2_CAEEX|nr:hypothetical protein CEXT_674661 [Caerostris extrusa]
MHDGPRQRPPGIHGCLANRLHPSDSRMGREASVVMKPIGGMKSGSGCGRLPHVPHTSMARPSRPCLT